MSSTIICLIFGIICTIITLVALNYIQNSCRAMTILNSAVAIGAVSAIVYALGVFASIDAAAYYTCLLFSFVCSCFLTVVAVICLIGYYFWPPKTECQKRYEREQAFTQREYERVMCDKKYK